MLIFFQKSKPSSPFMLLDHLLEGTHMASRVQYGTTEYAFQDPPLEGREDLYSTCRSIPCGSRVAGLD